MLKIIILVVERAIQVILSNTYEYLIFAITIHRKVKNGSITQTQGARICSNQYPIFVDFYLSTWHLHKECYTENTVCGIQVPHRIIRIAGRCAMGVIVFLVIQPFYLRGLLLPAYKDVDTNANPSIIATASGFLKILFISILFKNSAAKVELLNDIRKLTKRILKEMLQSL